MVRAFSSVGSFQGNTVISAFGQSDATSTEAISGCAATSSGSISIDVWHDFAKSRDTLYTKSGRLRSGKEIGLSYGEIHEARPIRDA
jgi:hypothetical protein